MSLNVPEPTYKYRTAKLVKAYQKATQDILLELQRVDITDLSKAQSRATLSHVAGILTELDNEAAKWVEENIPEAMRDGVARTLVNLEVVKSLEEAKKIVTFNRFNARLVEAVVADTQSDLLAVTQNINRRVRGAIRQVTAEAMRENAAKGITGRKTLKRETLQGLYDKLGKSVETGIVDAAGRKWKPHDYVDVLIDTKMNEAYREATTNEAVNRGAYYAIISAHEAKDACRFHERRIIKLTSEAPGDYPTYEELKATNQIFHPKCKHHFSVLRDINRLPENIREQAQKQAELGKKAMATGKRNPKDIE